MLPNIFTTLQASAAVRALLGARPRIFRMGEAPQDSEKPYATWLLISGVPELTLSETPAIDRDSIQLDVWSRTETECEEIAIAIRDRMEQVTHMTAFRVHAREAETRLYRIGMDFDYFLPREA
jgi:hypothetical protein